MVTNNFLYLKSNEDRRLKAGHLWIYSNEINTAKTPLSQFKPGQLVQINSSRGNPLGIGYINPHTLLCVRLLTRDSNQEINETFFVNRIQQALSLREMIFDKPFYRCIFAESDFLPGLIVDRYGEDVVVQINTAGMENLIDYIVAAVQEVLKPRSILLKNDSAIRHLEQLDLYVKPALGNPPEMIMLKENGLQFNVPLISGQKTGWFYDQRYNRARLQKYVNNKKVLDVFSYLGAWGIQAAAVGAKEVYCIDSSASAINILQTNTEINQLTNKVHTINADAFDYLKNLQQSNEKLDVIILDPPAFIKKRKDVKAGTEAYIRLNEMAIRLLASNSILITSSCSLHLSMENLIDVVRRAGIKSNRDVQILEQGHQAADHPIHPAIPETAYLKTLFCRVI